YKLFRNGGQKHLALISIWFGYLAQALISTDHIALVILGFISAALINSGYIHISQSDENQPVLKNSQIQRTITLSTLIVLIFIFYNFAQTERQSYLILNDSYSGNSINYYLNNDWIVPRTAEELAVKLAKGSDSETRGLIADKLLSVNNMSHQGWYFKAVAMEGQKDYVNALKYMNKAINLDPTNSVYLLSKSVIYIEKNDLISAKVYYLKTLRANPNQMGIDYVRAKLKDYL
ncbi:MAG: hypothetical protein RLZ57_976, partial [Actinomycetota bacterium]